MKKLKHGQNGERRCISYDKHSLYAPPAQISARADFIRKEIAAAEARGQEPDLSEIYRKRDAELGPRGQWKGDAL